MASHGMASHCRSLRAGADRHGRVGYRRAPRRGSTTAGAPRHATRCAPCRHDRSAGTGAPVSHPVSPAAACRTSFGHELPQVVRRPTLSPGSDGATRKLGQFEGGRAGGVAAGRLRGHRPRRDRSAVGSDAGGLGRGDIHATAHRQLRFRQDIRGVARHQPAAARAGKLRAEPDDAARRRRSRMPSPKPAGADARQRTFDRARIGYLRLRGRRRQGRAGLRGSAIGPGPDTVPIGGPFIRLPCFQHHAGTRRGRGPCQSSASRYAAAAHRNDAFLPIATQDPARSTALEAIPIWPPGEERHGYDVNVKEVTGAHSACARMVRHGARPSQKRNRCLRASSSSATARSLPSARSCSSSQKGGRSVRNRDNVPRSIRFMLSSIDIFASTDPLPPTRPPD